MGLMLYRVLPIPDGRKSILVCYTVSRKSFMKFFIIQLFFRTQKDFEMMTKMKAKLNPQNSVS